MRIIERCLPLVAALLMAAPALAMDDTDINWRVDGFAEKRLTSLAPATLIFATCPADSFDRC